jgi:hypothetical protein
MTGDPVWTRYKDRPTLIQRFTVDAGGPLTVQADCSVRLWGSGGAESERPTGAETPELIAWRGPDGVTYPAGRLGLKSSDAGEWEALLSSPPDTVTRVRIREATAEDDGG